MDKCPYGCLWILLRMNMRDWRVLAMTSEGSNFFSHSLPFSLVSYRGATITLIKEWQFIRILPAHLVRQKGPYEHDWKTFFACPHCQSGKFAKLARSGLFLSQTNVINGLMAEHFSKPKYSVQEVFLRRTKLRTTVNGPRNNGFFRYSGFFSDDKIFLLKKV